MGRIYAGLQSYTIKYLHLIFTIRYYNSKQVYEKYLIRITIVFKDKAILQATPYPQGFTL